MPELGCEMSSLRFSRRLSCRRQFNEAAHMSTQASLTGSGVPANLIGIPASSPGLRGTSYLGVVFCIRSLPPSPRPSPAGRGGIFGSAWAKGRVRSGEGGRRGSLSQRERAGVRENASSRPKRRIPACCNVSFRVERPTWPFSAATCRRASAQPALGIIGSPLAQYERRAGRPPQRAGGPFHPGLGSKVPAEPPPAFPHPRSSASSAGTHP